MLSRLEQRGIRRLFLGPTFNEFSVVVPDAARRLQTATAKGVVAGFALERKFPELKDGVLLAVNELHTPADLERLVEVLT